MTVRWTPNGSASYVLHIDSAIHYPTSSLDVQKFRALSSGTHTAYITAIDASGNESGPSDVVTFTIGGVVQPPPSPPPGPEMFPVELAWDPPVTNEDGTELVDLNGYNVYTNGSRKTSSQIPRVTLDVEAGMYIFRVSAVDTSNNESILSDPIETTVN